MGTPAFNTSIQPKFLRWAGSKTRLLPTLAPIIPQHRRYIEPFCGSCALFFFLKPDQAVLSDINPLLIRTLKAVRNKPRLVFETLAAMEWTELEYYRIRGDALNESDDFRLAANFIYLNANCFNGIFRLNRLGKFNVPYGASRAGKCPSWERMQSASKALRGARLICGDFDHVVRTQLREGDFVYLDPPFAIRNQRIFYQYRYDDFGSGDIQKLADLLQWIDRKRAKFIVSYAASPESELLGLGWRSFSAWRLGNVAGFKDNRRSAEEKIITNVQS